MPTAPTDTNRAIAYVAGGSAIVFVLALGAMVVRELFPHRTVVAADVSHETSPAEPEAPIAVSTTRALGAITHAASPRPAPEPAPAPATPDPAPAPAPAPMSRAPDAARAVAGLVADPR